MVGGANTTAGTDGSARARSGRDHRSAPRRRGDALNAAIFEATLHELTAVGYAELTMERVASRARASKGSLYRRWSSRAELVVDAVHQGFPDKTELPDTGHIRKDLLAFLGGMADKLNGPIGEAARGLMAETIRDPELMSLVRARFVEPGVSLMLEVLRRGLVRGEVRPCALTPRVASVGPALVRQHFMVYGPPIPDAVLVGIVDEVLLPLVAV